MRNLSSAKPEYEDFPEEDFSKEEIDKEPEEPEKEKPKPRLVESEKDIEQKMEKQEIKINTMADFIHLMDESIDWTEDEELKRKLGHQIVKLEMSLSAAKFTADKIYVEETPDGVLGLYYVDARKIALSKELIEDFNTGQRLITHVLYHERAHREGKADEAVAEKEARKHAPINIIFYGPEQRRFSQTFGDKGLKKYDFKHPDRLMDYYLEVELAKEFKGKTRRLEKLRDKDGLEFNTKKEASKHIARFKKSAPRLYNKLKERNYNIIGKARSTLRELSRE